MWKEEKEQHPIGARFGACMWIETKVVLSPGAEDLKNFKIQIRVDERGNQQDLGRSLWSPRVLTTKLHCAAPRGQNYEVVAV